MAKVKGKRPVRPVKEGSKTEQAIRNMVMDYAMDGDAEQRLERLEHIGRLARDNRRSLFGPLRRGIEYDGVVTWRTPRDGDYASEDQGEDSQGT